MGWNFSPLDEELGLLPGGLTPALAEGVAYAGTLLPFDQARAVLERLCGVVLSEPTVRRQTYAAGKAAEAALVRELERSLARPAERGPARQQVSADGAMVRTLGGEWKEVRTVAIGTVKAGKDGPGICDQTYYARLSDHDEFIRLSRAEFFRRATENVLDVEAVMDGAEWLSQLVEEHCPQALRILDFTHAVDAIVEAARAVFGQGTEACAAWIGPQVHELRHGDPANVLAALRSLAAGPTVSAEARATVTARHDYLARRSDQIQYATFAQAGYVIGSGLVESANKHVVQARLKRAGMQWQPAHANAILALACADRSNRWTATWQQSLRRRRRPHRHQPPRAVSAPPIVPPTRPTPQLPPSPPKRPAYFANGKPTAAHPFKRFPACRAKL